MRPVNLIPPEDRRGEQAPLRTGPLPYIVLGALVAVLVGITAMVLVSNQISESKAEVATLESEDATAAAQAQRLAAYTQFRNMSEQRVVTVNSLADSRFDWERVMRELSLVLPSSVWLVGLTATASPAVTVDGGSGASSSGAALRAQVPGPALELNGCASGQDAVAGFVTALKDIDGVTRVGVQSSELAEKEEETASSTEIGAAMGSTDDECRTRDFIAKFAVVVAFDAAPVPTEESSEATVAAPVESAESSSESSESTEGG
ncbi:MAG TPA: PilN domain-containing protein [Solirubrobacterales bacterium]|nr:PilN domain-containing protein [Solirubrobacterales bacterium]